MTTSTFPTVHVKPQMLKNCSPDSPFSDWKPPSNVRVIGSKNMLALSELTLLRNRETQEGEEFRNRARYLAADAFLEPICKLFAGAGGVHTPLGSSQGCVISGRAVMITILGAGAVVSDGILAALDARKLGLNILNLNFLAASRDEKTARCTVHYHRETDLSCVKRPRTAFITEQMLATGGTAVQAIQHYWDDFDEIVFLCFIAAPEGINAVVKEFGDTTQSKLRIWTVDVDYNPLTSDKFIYPGLGDGGDRAYGRRLG